MALSGTSASDIWTGGTPVSHWNGMAWTDYNSVTNVSALFTPTPSAAWAGGLWMYVWNGTQWTQDTSFPSTVSVNGMWGSGVSDIWVTGSGGSNEHWDGTTWTYFGPPSGPTLYGIWGTGPGDVWAADYAGEVFHHAP